MYEKIKKLNIALWNNVEKPFIVIFIISLLFSLIFITTQNKWDTLLTYPETEYGDIEEEATKMVKTKNLETDYPCSYTYNNKTDYLSFSLADYNNQAQIDVKVSNYNTDNQEIDIKRDENNRSSHIFNSLAALFLAFPLIVSLFLGAAIIFSLGILFLIAFALHKIRENFL